MKRLILLILLLPLLTLKAQMGEMPADPAVRTGKLPNGLTYYIRHNELPKDRANFYIAQRVGSVQEEESQRGLAHFLEHMCFNGTTNYPGNSIVEYLQSIGINFGGELNAYTSTDEIVYNINNVPVTPGHVDSCLLILHDWSHDVLLLDEEIDKERGAIHEEWRLRSSAMMRMYERNLETMYPGSRYGRRLPIGLMSVVDECPYDTLRAYYHRWFRPELQGIIVVGDIDVNEVEQKVIALFSGIANPENPEPYVDYPVPDNAEPIYIVDKDKEQQQVLLEVMFKHDVMPREYRNTPVFLVQDYLDNVIMLAVDARFEELSQKPDCPFLQAGCYDGNYFISKTKGAFTVVIVPKPGQDVAATEAVMTEVQRLRQYGLTPSEVDRAAQEYMSQLERRYDNRDKQQNSYFVNRYVRAYLDGSPISSIEQDYQMYQLFSSQLGAEVVNALLLERVGSVDTNFVFAGFYPERDDVTVPAVADLRAAVERGIAADVQPYADNVRNEPLVPVQPKPGKIKKETPSAFGYTEWTLANGARVYFKKTDFNESQVVFGARSFGGLKAVKAGDVINARLATDIVDGAGLGAFSATEFQKAMSGKQVNVSSTIGQTTEALDGSSTPKDLRTLFEIIYLKFTAPGSDVDSYNRAIQSRRTQLEAADRVPETTLMDSLYATFYNSHPYERRIVKADLDQANFETMRAIYAERFNSPGDFDFYFTGNFDVDSLRLFTETYLASLPKVKREAKPKTKVSVVDGVRMNRFTRQMETPKSYIIQLWHGDQPWTVRDEAVVDVLGQILSQRYLKSIREEGSMAYSVGASGDLSYGIRDEYTLQIYCPVKPEKADSALILMRQGIDEIAQGGVTADELEKAISYNVKTFADNQRENNYWEGLIRAYTIWGKDKQKDYEAIQRSITSADIQAFVKNQLLKQNNCATVLMLPE
ncbi:MAG: insulinase family protein [Bacteroidaceae bacterium]|nr:insulinase family protein [Bacteroidaceae bacterium]